MISPSHRCVLLADRHHGLTEGLRGLLETTFSTVVMVADEASLLESAEKLKPAVAVVDLLLVRGGGFDWLKRLRVRCPETRLIVISVHDETTVRERVMEQGVDAFVLKRHLAEDLLAAVDAVLAGRHFISTATETPDRNAVKVTPTARETSGFSGRGSGVRNGHG